MKTKVLVWWARNGGSAEQMLNDWITSNTNIKIVTVSQSEGGTVVANYRITYTIFYNEVQDEN